jgi:hypothetical protein
MPAYLSDHGGEERDKRFPRGIGAVVRVAEGDAHETARGRPEKRGNGPPPIFLEAKIQEKRSVSYREERFGDVLDANGSDRRFDRVGVDECDVQGKRSFRLNSSREVLFVPA